MGYGHDSERQAYYMGKKVMGMENMIHTCLPVIPWHITLVSLPIQSPDEAADIARDRAVATAAGRVRSERAASMVGWGRETGDRTYRFPRLAASNANFLLQIIVAVSSHRVKNNRSFVVLQTCRYYYDHRPNRAGDDDNRFVAN